MYQFSKEEDLPEFITKYGDEIKYAGYKEFVAIAREHKKELHDYDEIVYPAQLKNLQAYNIQSGENVSINREAALNGFNGKHQKKALRKQRNMAILKKQKTKIRIPGKKL